MMQRAKLRRTMKVYSGKDLLILGMKVEGLGKEENFVET
jgi:hypothetical protein